MAAAMHHAPPARASRTPACIRSSRCSASTRRLRTCTHSSCNDGTIFTLPRRKRQKLARRCVPCGAANLAHRCRLSAVVSIGIALIHRFLRAQAVPTDRAGEQATSQHSCTRLLAARPSQKPVGRESNERDPALHAVVPGRPHRAAFSGASKWLRTSLHLLGLDYRLEPHLREGPNN